MSPVPIVLKAIPVETICVCLCARLTRSVHSMRNVLKETACVSNHISVILYWTYFICKYLTCWMSKNCLQLNLFSPPVSMFITLLHKKVWSWECVSHICISEYVPFLWIQFAMSRLLNLDIWGKCQKYPLWEHQCVMVNAIELHICMPFFSTVCVMLAHYKYNCVCWHGAKLWAETLCEGISYKQLRG